MIDISDKTVPTEQRLRELEAKYRQEVSALRHELAVRHAELQAERDSTAAFKRLVANAAREMTTVDPVLALRRLASDGVRQLAARSTPIRPRRGRLARRSSAARVLGFQEAGLAQYVLDALAALDPPTIVVPVHGGFDELERCLRSIVRNTASPARLLVVDDASTDLRIPALLERFRPHENVVVLTNETNLGFTRSVNRALSESMGDVVLLNSDTEVTPRWLENLTLAAYLDSRVATTTALSDNAGAFSVPSSGKANGYPARLDKDDVGRLVMQSSAQIYPQSPTGGGFCMYIKRAVLDEVGHFDAASFPRGYGEENDFSMRARRRGWSHVVDDATFVFHAREASFGAEKPSLLAAGLEALERLHPEYSRLAGAFAGSEDMKRVGARVRSAYWGARLRAAPVRPRLLFVAHEARGGTLHTTKDLMGAVADRYSPYLLTADSLRLKLFRHEAEGPELVEEWRLRGRQQATEFSRPDYRAIVFDLMVRYRFELVHIRHLIWHTFDLPQIAQRLRVPVVLSFHDFYFSCPTVHLIDDAGNHCGGECTPGYGQCRLPFRTFQRELPVLKHAWLGTWRERVEQMFGDVDAFVTTSQAAKDIYLRSLPTLEGRRFDVIEHGRDLEQSHCSVAPDGGPARILVPGVIDVHKGGQLIRELGEIDGGRRLEFHLLGTVAPELTGIGVSHGPYERDEFAGRVAEIGPSFVAVLSIWPETYSHTLTEAWAVGVPVLASDIGTLRERVKAHGGGWLVDHTDPRRAYEQILAIADDQPGYARERDRATLQGIRSTETMANDYHSLYEAVLGARRPFAP